MGKLLNLDEYRLKVAAQRGFGAWQNRFGVICNRRTTIADLDDPVLYFLALPGEKYTQAYYELIMGVLDLGPAINFYSLEKSNQIKVTEIQLFLADQIRFELMRRLGWVGVLVCEKDTLLELVMQFDDLNRSGCGKPPDLSVSHPAYPEFSKLISRDQEVFIRQLLPKAIEAFSARLKGK